jgi:hypothetical protein
LTTVQEVESLAALPNLKDLWLGRLPITKVGPLAALPNLTNLTLWEMSVDDLELLGSKEGLTISAS